MDEMMWVLCGAVGLFLTTWVNERYQADALKEVKWPWIFLFTVFGGPIVLLISIIDLAKLLSNGKEKMKESEQAQERSKD